jgi:hypothetical protein
MRCRPGGSDCFSLFALSSSLMTSVHKSFFVRILNSGRVGVAEGGVNDSGKKGQTAEKVVQKEATALSCIGPTAILRDKAHGNCELVRSSARAPSNSARGEDSRAPRPTCRLARHSNSHKAAQAAARGRIAATRRHADAARAPHEGASSLHSAKSSTQTRSVIGGSAKAHNSPQTASLRRPQGAARRLH